jgi:hypothetical protein
VLRVVVFLYCVVERVMSSDLVAEGWALGTSCLSPIPAGIIAALLLLYPISVKQVHPIVQIAICASLTTVGLSMLIAYFACGSTGDCTSCQHWVIGSTAVFSLVNIIVPVLGSVVGMGTAGGLLMNTLASSVSSTHWINLVMTAVGIAAGVSILFINREMILHWQLIAPPVVGGYLAAVALNTDEPALFYSVWSAAALISIALHVRRRRAVSWLEKKQAQAVHSKESQIVKVMRSADPKMDVDEFEKLKERLLEAVDGDREQVDRVVFGGGLY